MNTVFTVEESNLISIFAGEGRCEVIEDFERTLHYLKDAYMVKMSYNVTGRLRNMSDKEFF